MYLLFANFSVCVLFCVLCLCIISKPAEKDTIEVGCKLEVIDRGVVYIAKVKFFFWFPVHIGYIRAYNILLMYLAHYMVSLELLVNCGKLAHCILVRLSELIV